MEILLKVAFNSLVTVEFSIENPPVLPLEGEIFSAAWDSFILDKKAVKKIKDYEEGHVFLTHVIFKHFDKDRITVQVSLFEENHYKESGY